MSSLGSNTTAAAFIGASVTLVLVIVFMVLMVILVRQCLAFIAKRNAIRQQIEQHRQQRQEMERQRRLSVTEPVNPTFDWHHSIRIAGTPPPTYHEAKKLPPFEDKEVKGDSEKEKKNEIDIGHDDESDFSINIDNIPESNQNQNEQVEENDREPATDNRTASLVLPNETVVAIESEPNPRINSAHELHYEEEVSI